MIENRVVYPLCVGVAIGLAVFVFCVAAGIFVAWARMFFVKGGSSGFDLPFFARHWALPAGIVSGLIALAVALARHKQ
jgi:hypothetical protein